VGVPDDLAFFSEKTSMAGHPFLSKVFFRVLEASRLARARAMLTVESRTSTLAAVGSLIFFSPAKVRAGFWYMGGAQPCTRR
jgi:hypothetical protein